MYWSIKFVRETGFFFRKLISSRKQSNIPDFAVLGIKPLSLAVALIFAKLNLGVQAWATVPDPPPAVPARPAGWSGFPTTRRKSGFQKSGFQKSGWRNNMRRITTSGLSRSPLIISCSAPGCRLAVSLFLLVKVISCSARGCRLAVSLFLLVKVISCSARGCRLAVSLFLLVTVISCSAPGCRLAVSLFLLVIVISCSARGCRLAVSLFLLVKVKTASFCWFWWFALICRPDCQTARAVWFLTGH